jgi:hypothetical protein
VEQAKLASQAPSSSTSFSFATYKMCLPGLVTTSFLLPSRSTNLNRTVYATLDIALDHLRNCIISYYYTSNHKFLVKSA